MKKNVRYNVFRLKNPADADSPCGKSYIHSSNNGTISLLRHLRQVHGNDDQIGEDLR